MSIEQITALLGWAAILNTAMLIFSTVLLCTCRSRIIALHQKLFAISEEQLNLAYFNYLGNYKMMVYGLNIMPYIALKIMGSA